MQENPKIETARGVSAVPEIERSAKRTLSLTRRTVKFFDQGVDFINRMPFIGKMTVKPAALDAVAERDIFIKQVRLVNAYAALGMLMSANISIGHRAVEATQNLLYNQYAPDDPVFWARLGFDMTYAAGHYASAIAQARLATRLIPTLAKNTDRVAAEVMETRKKRTVDEEAEILSKAIVEKDHNKLRAFKLVKSKKDKEQIGIIAHSKIPVCDGSEEVCQYLIENASNSQLLESTVVAARGFAPRKWPLTKYFSLKEIGAILVFNYGASAIFKNFK